MLVVQAGTVVFQSVYCESPGVLHSIMTERKATESDSREVSFS